MREKEYTNAIGQIKQAILKSQYQAAKGVNAIQLSLYYGIGRYVSENTGKKVWGTGALEAISAGSQGELPGLRGFSSANMKKMRIFYDQWHEFIESSPLADQLPMEEFLSVGFSHHMEILHKTTTVEERLFYVHQSYAHRWDKYVLRDMLRADIFHHQGALPNNFLKAMPSKHDAMFAVSMFRDEFFIDLLFYNRDLKSLVAIELKRGEFKPSYLGQLNFYLNVLDDKERREGENHAIGLILCKDMNRSVVELAVRSFDNPMGVATYSLPGDVPEEYKAMRPIMEHAKQLLEGKKVVDE